MPQSDVARRETSPTQPFPTKPPAFDRQGFTLDDLIDLTPEIKAEALKIASQYRLGPFSAPPLVADAGGSRQPSCCRRRPAAPTGKAARPIPKPACSTCLGHLRRARLV